MPKQVNVASDSEMPPMKKKDFYEMINNNDDAYMQKQKEIIKYKAMLEIEDRKNKALESLLEKEKAEKESIENQISNRKAKNEKSSAQYQELVSKSREKKEYIDKNMDKLVEQEIKNRKDIIDAFEKKYGVKI